MRELWKEKTRFRRIDTGTDLSGDIEDYLPYERLYKIITSNELQTLIQDAKSNHWQTLDLHRCGLESIPDELMDLPDLRFLDVGNGLWINDLIYELKHEQYIGMPKNIFSHLPNSIGSLSNLQMLNLNNTKISKLPDSISSLSNLQRLDLSGTPLFSTLPPEMQRYIFYGDEVQAVIRYILQMQSESVKKQYFNESKMVVVGQGSVGKSCVINQLLHYRFVNQHSTEGIDIEKWRFYGLDGEEYTLNVWDFGGQEIYHSTHQFFLTRRTLYLLVWDVLTEDEYGRLDYWLRTIQSLAGDSPVIIVVNKCDKDIGRRRRIENSVLERYPQIQEVFYISCRDGIQIPELRRFVLSQAEKLPLMKQQWLDTWLTVREKLETLAKEKNFIPRSEYLDICAAIGIDESEALFLLQYLHDLGIVLYYANDLLLKNLVILSPEWGTDAVYKVLDEQDRVLKNRNGILYDSDLPQIWKDKKLYPPEIYPYLLNLMENFQLAFKVDTERKNTYLVAELLNINPVKREWSDGGEALAFRYAYDFLPAGVMTRLIVSIHEYLETVDGVKQCWLKGAYLRHRTARAKVILYDGIDRKYLDIRIIGEKPQDRKDLLSIIRTHVDKINKRFKKIIITELVPCKCSPDCPHFFKYDTLWKAKERSKSTVECPESLEPVSVENLMNGIEDMKTDRKSREYGNINIYYGNHADNGSTINDNGISVSGDVKGNIKAANKNINKNTNTTQEADEKENPLEIILKYLLKYPLFLLIAFVIVFIIIAIAAGWIEPSDALKSIQEMITSAAGG